MIGVHILINTSLFHTGTQGQNKEDMVERGGGAKNGDKKRDINDNQHPGCRG